ncbi:uncharacterized protein LOC124127637 [Haliotis rufescens]|uniref:uncharacterized protein LOC124127637 n=1 Tax=Haliotis rufescens TaxID=6454 RepID=UPI00201ECA23|nr:uncharacterized protein LOC124127637 [Haliotis rufescens]XP_048242236.1 uncharacterized protein LOC124127637 [Haliotis rufescens]XP_048242240.1 uncharacterized protein LOC124127637 [Haliotis rufescens]XP_048242244.1 uncharacterized protein LOC124127637 [Haliotis rufescens]
MLLFVAGLITMSCLTLSVLCADDGRDALLYQVDIFLPPKEGRDETADILHIKETVKHLSDIDVLFSFKELGNPRIILVLDVEKACSWPQLTGFLSSKGYEFSVTSLYYDSDFAQELGVNMTKDMLASSFRNRDLLMGKMTFPMKGLSTLEYNNMLKWIVERQVDIINDGEPSASFRNLAEYPIQMIYIEPASNHRVSGYGQFFHVPRHVQLVVTRIENLDSYTGACQED